jgi:hypothetical protein
MTIDLSRHGRMLLEVVEILVHLQHLILCTNLVEAMMNYYFLAMTLL